eukprot:5874418-Prymnesium_polylepis.1
MAMRQRYSRYSRYSGYSRDTAAIQQRYSRYSSDTAQIQRDGRCSRYSVSPVLWMSSTVPSPSNKTQDLRAKRTRLA